MPMKVTVAGRMRVVAHSQNTMSSGAVISSRSATDTARCSTARK
jgi:hypothetical protein